MANAKYTPGLKMPAKNEFDSNGKTPGNQYRIYKPLFIDPNRIKQDLDRELESISQALMWVTDRLKAIESK